MFTIATLRDLIVIISGAFALVFGLYRYLKSREAEAILQIEIEPTLLEVTGGTVIDLRIEIHNLGKAAGYIRSEGVKECICSVRQIECTEGDKALHWEKYSNLLEPVRFLEDWARKVPGRQLIFEPGSAEAHHVLFLTDYQGVAWARVELVDREETAWRADRAFSIPAPRADSERSTASRESTEG